MSRGHDRERAVRAVLEGQPPSEPIEGLGPEDYGAWVARAAGSLGDADLVASWPAAAQIDGLPVAEVWLIEVKSTAGGPYERFGPDDRRRLRHAAERAGGRAKLAYWPPRGKLRFIDEQDWPR